MRLPEIPQATMIHDGRDPEEGERGTEDGDILKRHSQKRNRMETEWQRKENLQVMA